MVTRLIAYVLTRDYGFAPNPCGRFPTLATCELWIRDFAKIGDVVLEAGQPRTLDQGCLSRQLESPKLSMSKPTGGRIGSPRSGPSPDTARGRVSATTAITA